MSGLDGEKFEGAVAVLDILGFRHRMKSYGLEELRDRVVYAVLAAVKATQAEVQHDLERLGRAAPLRWLVFADTVVLYYPLQQDAYPSKPDQALRSVVFATSMILARTMLRDVPLRGAIAYGHGLVSENPAYYIGQPFLDAHDLESRQKWAGAVVDPCAAKLLGENVRLAKWHVPFSNNERRTLLAVNWPVAVRPPGIVLEPGGMAAHDGSSPDWDACFNSETDDVQRKREATESFFYANWATSFGPQLFS